MSALRSIRDRLVGGVQGFGSWQAEIPDQGRVALVGMVLLAIGLAAVWPPAAAIALGFTLVVVGLGVDFRHPLTASVLIAAVAAVLIVIVGIR